MELYTLHLHKNLYYERLPLPGLEALLAQADSSAEGSESLALWNIDTLMLEGDDGPRLREPLPAPLWSGSAASELSNDKEGFTLEHGTYLFCQARAADLAELRELLEWFLRESWWSGAPVRARLYLRLVREDGKTAAQALARNTQH